MKKNIIIGVLVLVVLLITWWAATSISDARADKKSAKQKAEYELIVTSLKTRIIAQNAKTQMWKERVVKTAQKGRAIDSLNGIKIAKLEAKNAKQQRRILSLRLSESNGDTLICLDSNQVRELNIAQAKCDSITDRLKTSEELVASLFPTILSLEQETAGCLMLNQIHESRIKELEGEVETKTKKLKREKRKGNGKGLLTGALGLIAGIFIAK